MVGVDHPQQGGPVKDDNDIWSWETDYSAMNSLVLGGTVNNAMGQVA